MPPKKDHRSCDKGLSDRNKKQRVGDSRHPWGERTQGGAPRNTLSSQGGRIGEEVGGKTDTLANGQGISEGSSFEGEGEGALLVDANEKKR